MSNIGIVTRLFLRVNHDTYEAADISRMRYFTWPAQASELLRALSSHCTYSVLHS